ncbi:hypothetical protein [Zooshikella sp. RANM57]|uniref:hypothetical protein n=1 Tax=Zooshikella sp. RANM57 TaxID=3425863 RepID=UPI003D6E59AA
MYLYFSLLLAVLLLLVPVFIWHALHKEKLNPVNKQNVENYPFEVLQSVLNQHDPKWSSSHLEKRAEECLMALCRFQSPLSLHSFISQRLLSKIKQSQKPAFIHHLIRAGEFTIRRIEVIQLNEFTEPSRDYFACKILTSHNHKLLCSYRWCDKEWMMDGLAPFDPRLIGTSQSQTYNLACYYTFEHDANAKLSKS